MFLKDPVSRLDYCIDWTDSLKPGAQIVASLWEALPDEAGGLSLEGPTVDGPLAGVWLTGGRRGALYRVVNRVEISDGGRDERSLLVRVEER